MLQSVVRYSLAFVFLVSGFSLPALTPEQALEEIRAMIDAVGEKIEDRRFDAQDLASIERRDSEIAQELNDFSGEHRQMYEELVARYERLLSLAYEVGNVAAEEYVEFVEEQVNEWIAARDAGDPPNAKQIESFVEDIRTTFRDTTQGNSSYVFSRSDEQKLEQLMDTIGSLREEIAGSEGNDASQSALEFRGLNFDWGISPDKVLSEQGYNFVRNKTWDNGDMYFAYQREAIEGFPNTSVSYYFRNETFTHAVVHVMSAGFQEWERIREALHAHYGDADDVADRAIDPRTGKTMVDERFTHAWGLPDTFVLYGGSNAANNVIVIKYLSKEYYSDVQSNGR